jgi:Mg-chelatase subunit ChlD
MNLGRVNQAQCINTSPPIDERCSDPAFALQNPDVCPVAPQLVVKPSFALACQLGSVQFKAFSVVNGVETDVSDLATFQSSDPNIAVVSASSGNATGLTEGSVSVYASYQGKIAFAELTVLGEDCCEERHVAMMVLVDRTRSMSQSFGGSYLTKLAFAKAAATRFISEVNEQKDIVGLMEFTASSQSVLSPPVADKDAVAALVPGIAQTQQLTTFFNAMTEAVTQLAAVTADLKIILLISDGEDTDTSYADEENPLTVAADFKSQGGVIIALGVRSHNFGYNLMSAFATGGFFLNAHTDVAAATLNYLSGLKGYLCAGNCTPNGDTSEATGALNYCNFINWNVVDGHVDLLGNGFLDLLPGNGLYVDLAGSRSAFKGALQSKNSYAIEDGKSYRIKLKLAGNQRVNASPNTVRVKVYTRNADSVSDVTAPDSATYDGTGTIQWGALIPGTTYTWTPGDANGFLFVGTDIFDNSIIYPNSVQFVATDPGGLLTGGTPFAPYTGSLTTAPPINPPILTFGWDFFDPGTAPPESYDYAVSYANANGETLLSPVATQANPGFVTFTVGIEGAVDARFSVIRFWRRQTGTTRFYLIGEADPNTPFFDDTLTNAAFAAAIAAGTIDACNHEATANTTGTPIVLFDQTVTINDFQQDFGFVNLSFAAPYDANVWLSIQQTATPAGYDATGLLLDEVVFENATDLVTLLDDDFDGENIVYTPPRCGLGSYGYYGYNCYGEGCLDEPPVAQVPDPNPLTDIEGGFTPPTEYNSSKQVCVTCGAGSINLATEEKAKTYFSSTLGPPVQSVIRLTAGPAIIRHLSWSVGFLGLSFVDFVLEGSTDGIAWNELHSQDQFSGSGTLYLYLPLNVTAYEYYRISFTSVSGNPPVLPYIAFSKLFGSATQQACATGTGLSTVSQQDADAKATADATIKANAALAALGTCVPVYTSTVSHTAHCPEGTFGPDVTKSYTAYSLNSQSEALQIATEKATELAEAELDCGGSNNDQPIVIPTIGKATPYPSVAVVEGAVGLITKVVVNLFGLTHPSPDDLQILLVSPAGTKVKLWQNAGGIPPNGVSNIDVHFDDAAGSFISDAGPMVAGTYKPTIYAPGGGAGPALQMDTPAPPAPYNSTLAAFIGETPNGSWALYVADDLELYAGQFAGGWTLTITSV